MRRLGLGDGGIRDSVSTVRSDSDGRGRSRRTSSSVGLTSCEFESVNSDSVGLAALTAHEAVSLDRGPVSKSFVGDADRDRAGFWNVSADDWRSLPIFNPVSARRRSRDGSSLRDLDKAEVGRGSRDLGSGMPLRAGGCRWSMSLVWQM